MPGERPKVSILVPVFNEEANVERAYRTIIEVFHGLPAYDFEIIFTDNHSTDRTFDLLRSIAASDPRVRVIRFARNYGYQQSLLVAYKAATGDCSVQIDGDLQDPAGPAHSLHAGALEGRTTQVSTASGGRARRGRSSAA